MNINLTLIIQMFVFALLVWATMRFAWPQLMGVIEERQKKIAQGLAAADRGEAELAQARENAEAILREARETLRREIGGIAVAAASKLLEREIDPRTHEELISKLAAQI